MPDKRKYSFSPSDHSGLPRFADPWSFRIRMRVGPDGVAELHGRPASLAEYRRGGHPAYRVIPAPSSDADSGDQQEALTTSGQQLRRRQAAAFARYRLDGLCSPAVLRTIEGLWFEELSLREVARREGVSPAAISDRVSRLRFKTPEFWLWWRLRHRTRRRRD